MISSPHDIEYPKREPRHQVRLRGFALHPWGEFTDLTVANLSYGGCEVRTAHEMRRGDSFELRVARRGIIQAEVCWSGLQRAGLKFIDKQSDAA